MSVQQTPLFHAEKSVDSYEIPEFAEFAKPNAEVDADILELVNSMSLKEKIGQMSQIEVGQFLNQETGEFDEARTEYWIKEYAVGSILDAPNNHGGKYMCYPPRVFADFADAVQKVAVEKGSRKVPLIYGLDSLHGANYVNGSIIFPQPVATAATFDPKFAYDAGRVAAKDTRAAGCQWIFAPCMDLNTSKMFPRAYENFGEDPYLSATMSAASVNGLQGDYKNDRTRVAACMKHFIGYSHPQNGWDKGTCWIPDHHLLEYFVPPFQACVDAGCASAMESYNDINGEPVVTSEFYLKTVLRDIMGFKGVLLTDWAEIDHTIEFHHTSTDKLDATTQAMQNTSIDMSMIPIHGDFCDHVHELVVNGELPESRVTESAARILQLKKDLGLFEQPYVDRSLIETVGSKQDLELALNAIRESITLLKNSEGVLPLKADDRVLVAGPAGDSLGYLSGGWTLKWQGAHARDYLFNNEGNTIVEGLKQIHGDVKFIRGVDIEGSWDELAKEQITEEAQSVDKIIICLGEDSYAENLGNLTDLTLAKGQLELVHFIKQAAPNAKIILILVEGRSRLLEDVTEISDAVVDAYLPGPWGGVPIAEVLTGKVNPSGRLPFSYPKHHSDTFITYYQKNPQQEYEPLFPFGAGIGYSSIVYSDLTISESVLPLDTPVTITVKVKNTGNIDAKEVVFLYASPIVRPGLVPERNRLRSYKKVELKAGEETIVSFELSVKDLLYVGRNLKKTVPAGLTYKFLINANRPEALE
ncbi:hypothetical protein HK096_004893, partial [Nowakowskiella sp. JEL0078]